MTSEAIEAAIELLPCPFCGKQPEHGIEYVGITLHRYRCIGCNFKNRYVIQAYGDTKEEAATVWNTRFEAARQNAEAVDVEALKLHPIGSDRAYEEIIGWNDCVIQLHKRGLLKSQEGASLLKSYDQMLSLIEAIGVKNPVELIESVRPHIDRWRSDRAALSPPQGEKP